MECPGRPVSRFLSRVIIYLGLWLPTSSSSRPGAFCGTGRPNAPAWPCSRWGLPGREHHCPRRWSLTPPFHPRSMLAHGAIHFSVALAVGLPRLAVSQHRTLWRADFPPPCSAGERSPGQPGHCYSIHYLTYRVQGEIQMQGAAPYHRRNGGCMPASTPLEWA